MSVTPSSSLSLSSSQRAFVLGAEALGATGAAHARPLPDLPVLPRDELDELIDLGIVREAADSRYYVYRSRRELTAALPPTYPPTIPGRFLKTFFFWLLMLLIPVALIQLTGQR